MNDSDRCVRPRGCGLELGNRLAATSRILLSTGNCAAQDRAPFAVFKRDSWGLVPTSVVVHSLRHTPRTAPERAKSNRAGPHTSGFLEVVTSVWKATEDRCLETSLCVVSGQLWLQGFLPEQSHETCETMSPNRTLSGALCKGHFFMLFDA